jgi:hypothetical protein
LYCLMMISTGRKSPIYAQTDEHSITAGSEVL